jgi:hypothetical protein
LETGTDYDRDLSDYPNNPANDNSAESGSYILTIEIPDSVGFERSRDVVRVLVNHQALLEKDLNCHDGFLLCEPWLNDILRNLTILGGYLQDIKDPFLMHDCRKAVERFDDGKIELQV